MKLRIPFLGRKAPFVPVIRLSGAIAAGPRGRLSDEAMAPLIEQAFSRGKPAAVALVINSPGGSPVQSGLIAARIRRLADEKGIPVHAFVEDIAASGGYWLATAADRIWLDPASITGSIGVISAGFGLQDLIARHGIERRVHTAGTSKSWLDPFRAENPEDLARLRVLLDEMHALFIAQVQTRRPQLTDPDLFTGEVWIGARAVERGLADGIAHLEPKMQELFGKKVRLRPLVRKRGFLSRFGIGAFAGASAGAFEGGLTLAPEAAADAMLAALEAVEERAAFARFGL